MERTQGLLVGLLGALKRGLAPSPRPALEEGGGSSRTRILLIGLFGAVAVIGVLVGLVGWQMGWITPEARPGQHRDQRLEQPASAMPAPAPSSSIAGPSPAAPGVTAPAPAGTPVAAPQAPAKSEGQTTAAAPAERRLPGPGVGALR